MKEKPNLKDRVERERQWHDERFSEDDARSGASRFYFALRGWYKNYDNLCSSHSCRKALEVGAGLETIALSTQFSFALTSIDISSKAIHALQSKEGISNTVFEVADAHELPYADGEFDFVFARGVLHHLDLDIGVGEIKRVLATDGRVVFGEPLAGNPLIQLFRFLTPGMRTPDERPLKAKDIRFVQQSFDGASVTYFGFLTLVAAVVLNKYSGVAARLDDFVLNKCRLGPYLAWACLIGHLEA